MAYFFPTFITFVLSAPKGILITCQIWHKILHLFHGIFSPSFTQWITKEHGESNAQRSVALARL